MRNQKSANAGLFLKELASRRATLPRLLQANLGNQFANADALNRSPAFAASAPALEENKIEQLAALPHARRSSLLQLQFREMLARFLFNVGVQAIAVRIHGDDRHEIVDSQMPHRFG